MTVHYFCTTVVCHDPYTRAFDCEEVIKSKNFDSYDSNAEDGQYAKKRKGKGKGKEKGD